MPQTTSTDTQPDVTGTATSAQQISSNDDAQNGDFKQPIGIYGWRKRCLYAFILFLMVIVIMNMALTIWILRVFDFSIDGIGRLRMTQKGVRLDGEAEFLSSVYTQEIRSKAGEPLYVESSQKVKVQSRNRANHVTSSLNLDNEKFQAKCEIFEIKDRKGKSKLYVDENGVIMGADEVKYNGEVMFNGSIETPSVRGPPKEGLRIESPTSAVKISGLGISAQAPAGSVELKSQHNITLQSKAGNIYLDAPYIYLKNIVSSDVGAQDVTSADIYQLCMCANGRIFLADATVVCIATTKICD